MLEKLDTLIPILGTLINIITVLIGSLIGLFINTRMPEKLVNIAFQAIGLFTVFLGIQMALKGETIIAIIFSLLIGSIAGELLDLERKTEKLIQNFSRSGQSSSSFAQGLITAFLLFCMGSMTFLGAIEEGTGSFPNLLIAKSVLDGFSSIALASTLGLGVVFSIIPLFLYQGGLTLFAGIVTQYLNESIINDLTATGGILLIGLGISLLKIKKVNVLNMVPALIIIVILRIIV
ncbi:MAG: DUF554 domain-containing protein [Calditrichia bacterium]